MQESQDVSQLMEALSKAQGKLKDPPLDSVNPHFKSKYASLPGGLKEIRPVLAEFKLSLTQLVDYDKDLNTHSLVTILGHASGQYLKSTMPLLLQKQDMQGLGAALTYARRQAVFAICGVAGDEDDDGNSVSVAKPQATRPMNHAPGSAQGSELSEAQMNRFWAMAKAMNLTKSQVEDAIKETGKTSLLGLTKEEYTVITAKWQAQIDKRNQTNANSN